MDRRFKKLPIDRVNIFILTVGIVFLAAREKLGMNNIYSKLFWLELGLILLPTLLFISLNKRKIRFTIALRPVEPLQVLYTVLAMIATYAMLVVLNATMLSFLSKFFYITDASFPEASDLGEYLLGIIVIGIIPAICEEIMYRGVVYNAYSNISNTAGILVSAFLFAVFHFTIENFISPLILGIVLGVIMYRSGSILLAIIGHATSNIIAVSIGYFTRRSSLGPSGEFDRLLVALLSDLNLILVMGIIFIISLSLVVFFVRRINRSEKAYNVVSFEDGDLVKTGQSFLNSSNADIRGGRSLSGTVSFVLLVVLYIIYNYQIYLSRLR